VSTGAEGFNVGLIVGLIVGLVVECVVGFTVGLFVGFTVDVEPVLEQKTDIFSDFLDKHTIL